MVNRRAFIAWGLAQMSFAGLGHASAPRHRTKSFLFYDELLHAGRPRSLGLEPCNVVYQSEFFPYGEDRSEPPNPATTKALGSSYGKRGVFTSLDLELYHGNQHRLSWYETITRDFRASFGDGLLSHYQTMPTWLSPKTVKAGHESAIYRDWQAENDTWYSRLGALVSAFSPSNYAYGSDVDAWEQRARAYAAECRRLNPKKPYVPYIWFDYHEFAGNKLALTPIPIEYWLRQLEVTYETADGVILWGGYKKRWRSSTPWWLATKKFIGDQQ